MTTNMNAHNDGGVDGVEAPHFVYFVDPMCSWCYGFSPVIQALASHFASRLPVRIVVGGLRAGNTSAMRDQDRAYIRSAWQRVNEASGQPFDFGFFERDRFVYDTEPACRAVVTMRQRDPGAALAFLGLVSTAFYANNRDTTDTDVLCDLAEDAGQERAGFRSEFLEPETRNATFRDFLFSQQSGVEGFPCLVAGTKSRGYALVAKGFRPADGLVDSLEGWLARTYPSS
ncbi:MAG: DsbA family protein [Hyphomicrobiaceae bacterium]